MKTTFRKLLLLILLVGFMINSFAQEEISNSIPGTVNQKLDYFLKLTDSLRKKGNNPGLAMAIFHGGELIYKDGLGYRNLEEQLPVTTNTLFEIGSLTKAFTGVLAARLVENGQMKWNDKISVHYPGFKLLDEYATSNATFMDFFTHRTGLAQHYYIQYGPEFTMEDVPEMLAFLSFDGSFREKYLYNNLIYTMAGLVEEKISGRSWNQMIAEDIFKPMGMHNSFTSFKEFKSYSNRSSSYQNDGKTRIPPGSLDAVAPAGSITSTINDMSRWVEMLLHSGKIGGESFLSEDQVEFLMSPHALKNSEESIFYGIGWDIDTKRKTVSHDGRTGGQSSRIVLMPEEGFGIVILCNQQTDLQNLLTRYASNIFIREKFERLTGFEDYIEDKAQPQRKDELEQFTIQDPKIMARLKDLEGEYEHPAYGTIQLQLKEENLLTYEYYDFRGSVEYTPEKGFVAHTSHFTGKDVFPFRLITSENDQVEAIEVNIPYSKPLLFNKENQ